MLIMIQSGFRAIIQKIVEALWVMIEREIGIFRLNNIPKQTFAPVPSGSLFNIFGTGEKPVSNNFAPFFSAFEIKTTLRYYF